MTAHSTAATSRRRPPAVGDPTRDPRATHGRRARHVPVATYRRRRRALALCALAVVALTGVGLATVVDTLLGGPVSAPLSMPLLVVPWMCCAIALVRWSAPRSSDSGRRPASPAAVAELAARRDGRDRGPARLAA